jgi:WD40 repeat protein
MDKSDSFFIVDRSGVCVRIRIEPPHIRTLFPAMQCSRVIDIDFHRSSASLYLLVVKETPRGGGFTRRNSPPSSSPSTLSKTVVPPSPPNREGINSALAAHPGDFIFKAKEKHTRPNVSDCAEDFAGFATLDTTLQLLRCSASGCGEIEVIFEAPAAGNMLHSLVVSCEQASGSGVSILFGAKQLTPEFAKECKGLGITTFVSTIPLGRDDTGCTIAAASPLLITLHFRGEGAASGHWSKTTAALTQNAQCCSLSPDGRALAVLLSNCSVVLFVKSSAIGSWEIRGKCLPRPTVGLRSMAVAMRGLPASSVSSAHCNDVLVAISSTQGIVQVWCFTSFPATATASTASTYVTSAGHSPPKRSSASQLDDAAAASHGSPMSPFLCGLHSVGACSAHDDLRVAFLRSPAGSSQELDGFCVVAADAIGTLKIFEVQTSVAARSEKGTSGVVMISDRGDRKQEQFMPAIGCAAAVVAFALVPPCNLVTLDSMGMIMSQSARTSTLIAKGDGCDITRVDCFVMRDSVAIGSELPLTHPMNFSQRDSYMFTGSSDGSLRSFDKDFICYWQARVCDCGISCLVFSSDSLIHIGCINGRIMTFNLSRCAVGWSELVHSGRVQAIDATPQNTASIADDGIVIVTNSDGIVVYSLRCDVGWCGVKFTQMQSLATVSNGGKLQVRSLASMPPKSAAESDVTWNCRIEVDVDTSGGRCTAFDVLERHEGGGVAVLAIGQGGADENVASDVTAVVVDLTHKTVVVRYRGPSAAITSVAIATGNWSLLPPLKSQETRGASRRHTKKDAGLVEDFKGQMQSNESGLQLPDAAKHVAAGGFSCLSGVNAIVASCRDGTGGYHPVCLACAAF